VVKEARHLIFAQVSKSAITLATMNHSQPRVRAEADRIAIGCSRLRAEPTSKCNDPWWCDTAHRHATRSRCESDFHSVAPGTPPGECCLERKNYQRRAAMADLNGLRVIGLLFSTVTVAVTLLAIVNVATSAGSL
jgi:hypothetical protein